MVAYQYCRWCDKFNFATVIADEVIDVIRLFKNEKSTGWDDILLNTTESAQVPMCKITRSLL